MNSYEVFFERKYFYRFNNFVTVKKLQILSKKNFTDDAIDIYCAETASNSMIKNIFNKHLKHELKNETNKNEDKNDENNENKSQKKTVNKQFFCRSIIVFN